MIWGSEIYETLPWAWIVLLVLILDFIIGDPKFIYDRIPHPVVWMGKLLSFLEKKGNRDKFTDRSRKLSGVICLILFLGINFSFALILNNLLTQLSPPELSLAILIILSSIFLSSRCLIRHVKDVITPLEKGEIPASRKALGMIVGRKVDNLDQHAISRAAIESLSENFSDGVIAPTFWFFIGGLPGLIIYKAVNTADSMIGHKNARYREFGWAAARLDDVMNFIPARITALLIILACLFIRSTSALKAAHAAWRFAPLHRSPNAGWPESAMAGACAFKLGGPISYNTDKTPAIWLGDGVEKLTSRDITKAVNVIYFSISIFWFMLAFIGGIYI